MTEIYIPMMLKKTLAVVGSDAEVVLPDEWAGVLPVFYDIEELEKIFPDAVVMTADIDEDG